jgi:hypothetical protein
VLLQTVYENRKNKLIAIIMDTFRSEKLSTMDRIRTARIQKMNSCRRSNNMESGRERKGWKQFRNLM